jgi:hypothetical protein
MYDIARSAYRNMPVSKDTPKKTTKSFGLLSRNSVAESPMPESKDPRQRVADYVAEIRREREKLKNG